MLPEDVKARIVVVLTMMQDGDEGIAVRELKKLARIWNMTILDLIVEFMAHYREEPAPAPVEYIEDNDRFDLKALMLLRNLAKKYGPYILNDWEKQFVEDVCGSMRWSLTNKQCEAAVNIIIKYEGHYGRTKKS